MIIVMMKNFIVKMCSTFFFVGFAPVAPGSFGTLAGVVVCLALYNHWIVYSIVFLVLTVIGVWSAQETETLLGKKDPGCVVIDEVVGIMVTFFMIPFSWPIIIVGYFLFRAVDMFKIYPANRLETMGGGVGIVADDLLAGLYANLILQAALFLNKIW